MVFVIGLQARKDVGENGSLTDSARSEETDNDSSAEVGINE